MPTRIFTRRRFGGRESSNPWPLESLNPSYIISPCLVTVASLSSRRKILSRLPRRLRLPRWRSGIGGRRVLHPKAKIFSCFFSFPIHGNPLTRGVKHGNGPLPGTFLNTAPAIPAFLSKNDQGRFFLVRVGYHDIGRADLHT